MGDINLLDRINKLANKFKNVITSSDKATKSKFGVVMIGDGINVSSGKISVPPASGFVADVLWEGDLTNAYVDITSALVHPVTDYKFLTTCRVGGSAPLESAESGQLLYVSAIGGGNNVIATAGTSIQCKIADGVFSIKAQSALTGVKLIGIK